MLRRFAVALVLPLSAIPAGLHGADRDDVGALLKQIKAVGKEGAGSPAARAAWDRLVERGPAMLPDILEAMDTPDTAVVNWLRTAFDRIVDRALQDGGKKIDLRTLRAYVENPKKSGRARRLALEVVEHLQPGATRQLVAGRLDDPEFRYEAVELALEEADGLAKQGKKDQALAGYRDVFAASRDVQQARTAAVRLKDAGVQVSVARHLGFLTDWYVIGPFDARGMKGFKTVYPPEEKVDLSAEFSGKGKKIRWQRHRVVEPPPTAGGHAALVNLQQVVGNVEDAVAYAYTAFTVPEARTAEFRGAADDNLTVWVNGKREFGFEEYRNGVRLDRHRFRVKLKAGENTVLVKVCQAPIDPTSPEPNWEFFLRVVDDTGKGIDMKNAPAENPRPR